MSKKEVKPDTLDQYVDAIDIYIPELESAPNRLHKRPWSDWEIKVLVKYYGKKPNNAIGNVLKRSGCAIEKKARDIGLVLYPKED